ncbi:MAG: tetratricopeptide (TPR) repeat protein [Saprospiraceae bacterium]|jgi:tetratricopeptide (TPR) repeat protein
MRIAYIYLILLLSVTCAFGQTQRAWVEAAESAYDNGDYYSALSFYLEAIDFDSTDIEMTYMIAESARKFQSYELAEDYYKRVMGMDSESAYPKATYWLAQMQQDQGKYDMAKRSYEMYLSTEEGDDSFVTTKAQKEISAIDWAAEMINNPEESVEVSLFEGTINTAYSEIGATINGDEVVYSSVAYLPEDRKKYGNRFISKILTTEVGGTSGELQEGLNSSNLHTAHTTYNLKGSKMYYTICEYIEVGEIRCDIYARDVNGDGSLGVALLLPSPINMDSVTNTQPNIGFDKQSGNEILYFVSDREGGKGKLDIWSVSLEAGDTYGTPKNLSVNTASDDISPFLHNNSQVLYFSSDGYTTFGGFDVFRSASKKGSYGKPENLMAPTNSSYNDVFYSLNEDGEKALFSSNRVGSQYIDELNKSCCYDIYKADISDIEINLNALTFDAKSLDSLEGVTVKLVAVETGTILNEITNDIANDHIFKLERNNEYMIVSSKEHYATDTMLFNTNTVFKSGDNTKRIYLKRTSLDLQVFTFDDISQEILKGTTVRLIDLTDGTIQEVVIKNDSGNDFLFNVVPGHSYKVEASRDRYYSDSVEFVAKDNDGSGIIVKKLYLVRRDLNVYLPLALYFDNDHPDLKSDKLITSRVYSETFDEYILTKQDFKEIYSSKVKIGDRELAAARVDEFFEIDVKGGFDRFTRFLDYMTGQLQDGYSFDLSLRGFASPRADTRYNLALSQRRLIAVRNELRTIANGVLVPFIESGQLKITELSFGESLAPNNVSDGLYDRRNSVYSPEASRERRVEIVEIKEGGL